MLSIKTIIKNVQILDYFGFICSEESFSGKLNDDFVPTNESQQCDIWCQNVFDIQSFTPPNVSSSILVSK